MQKERIDMSACLVLSIAMLFFATQSANAKSLKEYKQSGVSVAVSVQWHPYSFVDNLGIPKGFLIDYWNLWSAKTGVPVIFRPMIWRETIQNVASGETDIHCGLFFNSERQKQLDFSLPIMPLRGGLLIDKRQDLHCDDILEGHTIGVSHKGYAEYYLKHNYPKVTLRPYTRSAEMLDGLLTNEVQGVAVDYAALKHEAMVRGVSDRLKECLPLYSRDLMPAVARGNTVLISLVDSGMSQITVEERDSLARRWFVEDEDAEGLLMSLAPWVTVFLLLALGLIFWVGRGIKQS